MLEPPTYLMLQYLNNTIKSNKPYFYTFFMKETYQICFIVTNFYSSQQPQQQQQNIVIDYLEIDKYYSVYQNAYTI